MSTQDELSYLPANQDDNKHHRNIAQLYSQLQTAIDQAQRTRKQARIPPHPLQPASRASTSSDPYSISSTDSTDSPITPKHPEIIICACQQFIVSSESNHCGLCDQPLPQSIHIARQQRQSQKKAIEDCQAQLINLNLKTDQLQTELTNLRECHETKQDALVSCIDQMHSLQHDLKVVEQKYQAEVAKIDTIKQATKAVQLEMEDLSERLFEEVHNMMQVEQAEKKILQVSHDQLADQLKETQNALELVTDELETVRQAMTLVGDQVSTNAECLRVYTHDTSAFALSSMARAHHDLAELHNLELYTEMQDFKDTSLVDDFGRFVGVLGTISLRRLYADPFMKHCLREDIEPCLRFGNQPRVASKKIIESIQVKTCFIEVCPKGFANSHATMEVGPVPSVSTTTRLWSRFSASNTTPSFSGCGACGRHVPLSEREAVLKYRFRISYFDSWTCIDRYCRDRLMAVIEFFLFIRAVRMGSYRERRMEDIYEECMRLKLQMFLARMGSLAPTLQEIGLDPSSVGKASVGLPPDTHSFLDDGRSSTSTESTFTTVSSMA
ncbi:hypothetical protein CLU79DRAFT_790786 [Phycomyces nitens]|nr:hypothetical protein CLU79DRAFT_790786 [Phycomyces nitens]